MDARSPYKQERAIKSKPRTWNNIICTTRWYAPKLGESADHAQILPVCLLLVNPRILPCSVNFWCIPSEEITSKKSSNIVSLYFCYKHDTYSLVKKQIMWIGKKEDIVIHQQTMTKIIRYCTVYGYEGYTADKYQNSVSTADILRLNLYIKKSLPI